MTKSETEELFDKVRKDIEDIDVEITYLRWFKETADFGPADSDVHMLMDEQYTRETGKEVPAGWKQEGE